MYRESDSDFSVIDSEGESAEEEDFESDESNVTPSDESHEDDFLGDTVDVNSEEDQFAVLYKRAVRKGDHME